MRSLGFSLFCAVLATQPVFAQDDAADPLEAFQPAPIGPDERKVVDGLNQFGTELYAKLRGEPGSVIVSPASVSTAFGLAYAGAKGVTADEIAATLHYPMLPDFHGAFGRLLDTMQLNRPGRTLSVNNAIWLQTGLPVQESYLSLVTRSYGAGLERVNFNSDAPQALRKINGWVESKTNNRIRNLLSSMEVNKETRSVLVNTIYLKADWAEPFDRANTKTEKFSPLSGAATQQPLMHQRRHFAYAEKGGAKALIMPYRGGETDMVLLLPPSNAKFTSFEMGLTATALDKWIEAATAHEIIVTLPKFKVERRYELKPTLEAMGMVTPFSNRSDFSGMSEMLKIGAVIHQIFVEVEEKGTEAAAATAITTVMVTGMRRTSPPPPPKIFRADRPFLFAIRDRRTKTILFVGRYVGADAN